VAAVLPAIHQQLHQVRVHTGTQAPPQRLQSRVPRRVTDKQSARQDMSCILNAICTLATPGVCTQQASDIITHLHAL
jgi:hypothetical protein